MTKRQLIDEIISINQTAEPGFLSHFQDGDLREYLDHLQTARVPRVVGDASRYDKYFAAVRVTPPAEFGLGSPAVSTETDAAERAALLGSTPPAEVAEVASRPAAADQPAAPVLIEAVAPILIAAAPAPATTEDPGKETEAERAEVPADVAQVPTDDALLEAADDVIELQPEAKSEESGESADDAEDDSPAAEEPTTRRDSISARIARAWRQSPGDDEAGDMAGAPPVAEEAAADAEDVEDTEPASAEEADAPADPVEEQHTEPAELVPALAAGGRKEQDSQTWLF